MENIIKKDVKVFVGGKESVQRRFYIPAKAEYTCKADFDELSIEDLCRTKKFTAIEYLDWAFSGEGYMQLAHPLQENDLDWDFLEFQKLLLEYAERFVQKGGKIFPQLPTQMGCNIMLQNKFGYISSISDMFIPSFRLDRTEDGELDEERKSNLWDFLTSYYEIQRDHTMGTFVFKAPYTSSSKGISWPKSLTDVLDQFKCWCLSDKFRNKPYFFVQPRLANRQVNYVCDSLTSKYYSLLLLPNSCTHRNIK
jgi:hypothetical protein